MRNKTKDNFSVTVVIPAYNCQKYLSRSLNSVFAQTRMPDEIIVVDDGSSDDTAEIAREYFDKITFIQQENSGASAARNAGIEAAKSQWIAFLDADDEWLPEYLESQFEILKQNSDLVWVTGNYYTAIPDEGSKAPWYDRERGSKKLKFAQSVDFFDIYSSGIWGCTDTTIVRTEVLLDIGGFTQGQKHGNDTDMWFRIAYKWPKVGFNVIPLSTYYLNAGGLVDSNVLTSKDDFVARHLFLAQESGKDEKIRPVATYVLKLSYRAMLFTDNAQVIRQSIERFSDILSWRDKALFWLLTISPKLTKKMCLGLSFIIRKLNLRKRVVRKPRVSS